MSRKYDYDTAAIRAQARQIRSCRDKLTQTAEPRVRTIQNALNGRFVGLAADALACAADDYYTIKAGFMLYLYSLKHTVPAMGTAI